MRAEAELGTRHARETVAVVDASDRADSVCLTRGHDGRVAQPDRHLRTRRLDARRQAHRRLLVVHAEQARGALTARTAFARAPCAAGQVECARADGFRSIVRHAGARGGRAGRVTRDVGGEEDEDACE